MEVRTRLNTFFWNDPLIGNVPLNIWFHRIITILHYIECSVIGGFLFQKNEIFIRPRRTIVLSYRYFFMLICFREMIGEFRNILEMVISLLPLFFKSIRNLVIPLPPYVVENLNLSLIWNNWSPSKVTVFSY